MTEVFPISCLACRKRKIRCNRVKPCTSCSKRNTVCEYPQTFRNTEVHTTRHDSYLAEEVSKLKHLCNALQNENTKLDSFSRELANRLRESHNKDHPSDKTGASEKPGSFETDVVKATNLKPPTAGITITGETTELGDKYYGPSSSNYMIQTLKEEINNAEVNQTFDSSAKNAVIKANPKIENKGDTGRAFPDVTQYHRTGKTFSRLLVKKKLPQFVSTSNNMEVIKHLVELFFLQNPHHLTFIDRLQVLTFLENYNEIEDDEWELDDEILLLSMILSLLLLRISPSRLEKLGIFKGPAKDSLKFKKQFVTTRLFSTFENLRHNLINESISTIQAYVLCIELFLIEQRYEESWSMMFHACSISYAIGLHAMRRLKYEEVTSHITNEAQTALALKDDLEEYEMDIQRFKVWFALKNISGQVCSILGRPNPISIQVNSNINIADVSSLSDLKYDEVITRILLKSGLSECLRLSNMLLIENFMVDYSIDDVLKLDFKFDQEIKCLEWFKNFGRLHVNTENMFAEPEEADHLSSKNDFPKKLHIGCLLKDLIILYINRAKLLEPFLARSESSLGGDQVYVIAKFSILTFLDYTIEFVQLVIANWEAMDSHSQGNNSFVKLFRYYYPCLNSFIYQGVVVIFTFLIYKSKTFVNVDPENPAVQGINAEEFLSLLEGKLKFLKSYGESSNKTILWSLNILEMIDKILGHVSLINEKRSKRKNALGANFVDDEFFAEDHVGFNVNDPFWLRDPSNFPYILSCSSEDGVLQASMAHSPVNYLSADYGGNTSTGLNLQTDQVLTTPSQIGSAPSVGSVKQEAISPYPVDSRYMDGTYRGIPDPNATDNANVPRPSAYHDDQVVLPGDYGYPVGQYGNPPPPETFGSHQGMPAPNHSLGATQSLQHMQQQLQPHLQPPLLHQAQHPIGMTQPPVFQQMGGSVSRQDMQGLKGSNQDGEIGEWQESKRTKR